MHNMELNNWINFVVGAVIPAEVNFINLDTRDFQWVLSTSDLDEMDEVQNAYNYFMMQSDDFKRRHSTTMESLPFLVQYKQYHHPQPLIHPSKSKVQPRMFRLLLPHMDNMSAIFLFQTLRKFGIHLHHLR